MAKIPAYEVSQTIAQPTAPDPRLAAQSGKQIENLGEDLVKVGEQYQKLRNDRQKKEAELSFYNGFDQIHLEADQDPDPMAAIGKANDKIQKLIDTTSNTIEDPGARQDYMDSIGVEAARRKIYFDSQLMKKEGQLYKSTYLDMQEKLADEIVSGGPQDRDNLIKMMEENKNKAVSLYGVDPGYAQLHLNTLIKGLPGRQFDKDITYADTMADPVGHIQSRLDELKKAMLANTKV